MAVTKVIKDDGGTIGSGSGSGSGNRNIEDLTSLITGSRTEFPTSEQFIGGKISVYLQGIRMRKDDDYTEAADRLSIGFPSAPLSGEKLIVEYDVAE